MHGADATRRPRAPPNAKCAARRRRDFALRPGGARASFAPMIAAVLLIAIVIAYRIALGFTHSSDLSSWLHNFAPLSAIALCGAMAFPRRWAFALPLVSLFISDLALNLVHYRQPMLTFDVVPRYFALALITCLGLALRGRVRLPGLLGGALAGSVVFYVITNTGSWIHDPAYAKTFGGWLQALTTGVPGFPPTWAFYRHTLVSDLLFTLLFAGCMAWRPAAAPQIAAAETRPSA
jgi:hypothetical protein